MNKRVLLAVAAIVATTVFTGTAMATPISVGNYSFQSNVVADGASFGHGTTAPAAGWSVQTGNPDSVETVNPTSADFSGAAANGALPSPALSSQALFNAATASDDNFVITRNTGSTETLVTLDAGMQYTYTVAIGQALTLHGAPSFGAFELELYDATAGKIYLWSFGSDTPSAGTFKDYTVTFNANDYIGKNGAVGGDALKFGIVLGMQDYADNVRIDEHAAPVGTPEPSTLVLLAAGLMGMVAYAWRKRRRTA
jgi:hypothetical protein